MDINKSYSSLLSLYQTDYAAYVKKSGELESNLPSNYNFKYDDNFIPYPEYNDPLFNKKIQIWY